MSRAGDWQSASARGLLSLIQKNRGYLDENVRRLQTMHQLYIEEDAELYGDAQELESLDYYVRAVSFKYHLVSLSLEQLQAVRHSRISEDILQVLENSLETLDCTDDDRLMVSYALEGFLFQAMAFLDLYMIFSFR